MEDATRAKILDAARELCRTRSFSVQTKEIAQAAGVAEATLFRRFSRRAELLETLVCEILDDVRARMKPIQEASGAGAAELIRAMNGLGFDHVDRYGRLATDLAAGDLPTELMRYLPTIHSYWAYMESVISQGIESGAFRQDLSPRIATVMWRALLSTASVEILGQDSGLTTNVEIAEAITDVLVASFARRS